MLQSIPSRSKLYSDLLKIFVSDGTLPFVERALGLRGSLASLDSGAAPRSGAESALLVESQKAIISR